MNMETVPELIDEATDIIAVLAIAAIIIAGSVPSNAVLGAIVSIALGKRVLKQGGTQ